MDIKEITAFFTNRYNQVYLKGHASTTRPGASSTASTQVPISQLPGLAEDQERIHKAIQRAFIVLKGKYGGREVWIDDNLLGIEDEISRLQREGSELSGAALRNVAISNLWNSLDDACQAEWERKASQMADDVEEYVILLGLLYFKFHLIFLC